ncbi:HAMP domain-containing sensor histidine kinase [Thalassobaculum litoreum]|uniref:histidine kinase n=1 Tax=Thalassobaculum litoreum DSM 18839 TaxID=1123362 RepID=A0A8G2EUQ6_9PROT|nr:HAMP domain-containing sensor histidine kinase [Thalassobaculum litoreum]SDF50956.1 His Kinase A (phospho-acceptor) domain-containing protein [Thalassobaculum litoreum DSM 18839]
MSFRLKTILGVALIQALLLAAMVVSSLYYLRASNQTQLDERARTTAKLIATMTRDSVVATDLATLDALVEQVLTNPDIDYLRVRGVGGEVLAQGGDPDALGAPFQADDSPWAVHADGRIDIAQPIDVAGRRFGMIELGLSITALQNVLDDAVPWMGAMVLIELALVGLLGLVLGQYLMRQLGSLRDGAGRVASGDFGYQIAIGGTDELAQTARSFNAMSQALAGFAAEQRAARDAAERKSYEAEAILTDAVASMAEAILIADDHGRVLRVNDAFRRFYPAVTDQILAGGSLRQILSVAEELYGHPLNERIKELETRAATARQVSLSDGRRLLVDHRPTGLGGVVIVAKDVTELAQAQERTRSLQLELMQSQKLESLGTLAAGIAHEINTPMQFIGDNLRFLEEVVDEVLALRTPIEALPEDFVDEVPSAIRDSLAGVARVGQIVGSMRSFAHPDPLAPEPNDLNECVRVTTNVSRNLWKQVAKVELELDEALPRVPCKPGEINQVVLNLISNAVDAIDEARAPGTVGTITIRTLVDGDMAEIQVQDDGPGMPPEVRARIFDMFYTTKPTGKGTGQGLAIVAAILAGHKGRILVDSTPGEGTTFRVRLPLKPNRDAG